VSARNSQLRTTVSIGLAIGLLASGCGDKNTTTPTPSTPASTSTVPATSSTPTPTSPTLPAAAKGITITSADAFSRFYLQVIDYAAATGDITLLVQSSDKGCISCGELSRHYSSVYKAGGSLTGDFQSRNVKSTGVRLNGTKAAEITLRSTEGRHTLKPSATAKPTPFTGEAVDWTLTLANQSGQWVMYEIVQK
jgi:hypothetical protein